MKQQIQELLNKKMDRRDFLKHVGIGALLLMGLGTVIKMLGSSITTTSKTSSTEQQPFTYGSSVYGGKRST